MRWAFFVFMLLGTPATSQSLQDRAGAKIDDLGPVSQFLTEDALEDVVVPFETDTPFEASLGAEDLGDAVIATRAGNTTASQAFRATVDSATGRPKVAPSSGAMGLANLAVSVGADAVAGLFTEENATCSTAFDGPIAAGTYGCSAPLTRDFRTCRETRRLSVNREDRWACSDETPEYRKTCARPIEWRCTGATGGTCLQNAVHFSRPVTWNASGNTAEIKFSGSDAGACALHEATLQITLEDIANLTSLRLDTITNQGVAQIRVNSRNVWTHGSSGGVNLTVESRDCGKNCAVDAVYAGSTWIEDCGSSAKSHTASIELSPEFSQADPGPNTPLETIPVRTQTGALSNTVEITLITANTQETDPSLRFALQGSCCSEFTASLGGSC